jgi:3-hydroxybutyryl-CoA dehydrogenase
MVQAISVIGAGTMGNGIAHVFAQYGFRVTLIDLNKEQLAKAMQTIARNLDRQVARSLLSKEDKQVALLNILPETDFEKGVRDADLVIEAATENTELKLNIFKKLEANTALGCILASNTSSISITKIASVTKNPERVIGMHFMNPVPVMKLVEIINGYATKKEVTDIITGLTEKIDKTPCVVNDYPGFIANRILMPMINEAIFSLYEGVAGVETIDRVMKLGMAFPMGPLQLADFIGLDICHSILCVLYDGFGNAKYAPCPLLTKMVTAGFFGIKTGEGFYSYLPGTKELKVSKNFS